MSAIFSFSVEKYKFHLEEDDSIDNFFKLQDKMECFSFPGKNISLYFYLKKYSNWFGSERFSKLVVLLISFPEDHPIWLTINRSFFSKKEFKTFEKERFILAAKHDRGSNYDKEIEKYNNFTNELKLSELTKYFFDQSRQATKLEKIYLAALSLSSAETTVGRLDYFKNNEFTICKSPHLHNRTKYFKDETLKICENCCQFQNFHIIKVRKIFFKDFTIRDKIDIFYKIISFDENGNQKREFPPKNSNPISNIKNHYQSFLSFLEKNKIPDFSVEETKTNELRAFLIVDRDNSSSINSIKENTVSETTIGAELTVCSLCELTFKVSDSIIACQECKILFCLKCLENHNKTHKTFGFSTSLIEKYVLKSLLGKGGFGFVLKVKEKGKESYLAAKFMKLNNDGKLSRDSNNEINALENLTNSYIIKFRHYEELERDNYLILFMELAEITLKDLIGTLEPQLALKYFRDICRGVSYLHRTNFIHKDLKPGNILIKDGVAKLSDFGLSIQTDENDNSISVQGFYYGTKKYMSPEILGGKFTKASDIWALGIILHELLTNSSSSPVQITNKGDVELRIDSRLKGTKYEKIIKGFFYESFSKFPIF